MATFRRGLDAEDRVCTKLEGFGCRIQRDPRLDHKHKLDFVITNYIDNPNFYSLGVQITTKTDILEKQEEFLRANQASRVTTKALYLELSDKVDLDDGGALAVLAVILEFQFNRSYANSRLAAARIYEDMTFQFYDLPARVKQLRERFEEQQWRTEMSIVPTPARERVSAAGGGMPVAVGSAMPTPNPGIPQVMQPQVMQPQVMQPQVVQPQVLQPQVVQPRSHELPGVIDTYVRQGGHGIIQGDGDNRYFFHISHVADENLREQLNAMPFTTQPASMELSVQFVNAGFTKVGARFPEARSVRLRR